MSKEGFRLFSIGKHKEAIEHYKQILEKDPNCLWAYRDKSLNHYMQNEKPLAVGSLTQAEARNDNSAVAYTCRAMKLFYRGKKEEAWKTFNKAKALNPQDVMNLSIYAYFLMVKSQYHEAIEICYKVSEVDRSAAWVVAMRGSCEASLNRYKESMSTFKLAYAIDANFSLAYLYHGRAYEMYGAKEEALKCFNKCLSFNPDFFSAMSNVADVYHQLGRHKEALPLYEKVVKLSNRMPASLVNYGSTLCDVGRTEEGINYFNEAIALEPKDPLMLTTRGEVFLKLNQLSNAVRDFTNASKLVKCGELGSNTTASNLIYIKGALVNLGELQEIAKEIERDVEERIEELEKNQNSKAKKFKQTLENLQKQKDETTITVIKNFSSQDAKVNASANEAMEALKQQYHDLQSQVRSLTTKVRVVEEKVANIEAKMQEIQTELDNKLDDFNKKLDTLLKSQDASPDDIIKVKDYFKAFLGTFSSLYVTSQVVDSGQVQLDADSTKATILSAAISFAPFVGSFLSNAVKSIGDFLESREMKQNARKMKNLAGDSTELSQIVGGAAYIIVTDPTKKIQILTITAEDMKSKSDSVFAKILKFCQNIGEEADALLYGKLYKTASAQLGHNDANQIIKEWLELKCGFDSVEKAFAQIILEPSSPSKDQQSPATATSTIPSNSPSGPANKKAACCNIF